MSNDCNCNIRVLVSEDEPVSVNVGEAYNYNTLQNKPSINGVTLIGNKTTSDLLIETGVENWELINTADFSETATNHVKFTKDSNNNDFSLKKYRLVFNLVGSETINGGRISYSNIDDSNRYAVTNLYFGLSYGGALPTAIVESVYQFPGQGTILLNTCNTRCSLVSMANGRWDTSNNNYNKTAPFTLINIFWGTECTGTIQLWGVK